MKSVVRSSSALNPGKQPSEDSIVESKEPIPLDRLTAMLAIGSLVFIGVTGAVLGILWDGPKKGVLLKPGANQPKVQQEQLAVADVELKPAILDPPARNTSGFPSSIPAQDLVTKGPPRSIDQTPPLRTKPTLKESDADSDGRERHHLRVTRRRHRRSGSSLVAIGRALGFRIAQLLDRLEDR